MPDEGSTRAFQTRQKSVAAGILFAGFAAALFIYVNAIPPADRPGDRPEDSKRYLRQMEVYGGTANVLASEAREWFEGLWHGRALALTVACLSIVVAGVAFIALTPLPTRVDARWTAQGDSDDREARQGGTSGGPGQEGMSAEGGATSELRSLSPVFGVHRGADAGQEVSAKKGPGASAGGDP